MIAHLASGGAPTIYDPGRDTPERRMQLCDMCHNFHSESQVTFVPSPTGFGRQPIRKPLEPRRDGKASPGQFYADGTFKDVETTRINFMNKGMRPENRIIVSKTDTKGIITYANEVFCEVAGYAPG